MRCADAYLPLAATRAPCWAACAFLAWCPWLPRPSRVRAAVPVTLHIVCCGADTNSVIACERAKHCLQRMSRRKTGVKRGPQGPMPQIIKWLNIYVKRRGRTQLLHGRSQAKKPQNLFDQCILGDASTATSAASAARLPSTCCNGSSAGNPQFKISPAARQQGVGRHYPHWAERRTTLATRSCSHRLHGPG